MRSEFVIMVAGEDLQRGALVTVSPGDAKVQAYRAQGAPAVGVAARDLREGEQVAYSPDHSTEDIATRTV